MDILKISQVYDQNNNLRNEILPIFITVDPERDDQITLKNFIENFNDAFIGLTGTSDEINQVIKSFKIYVNYNKKNENDKTYLVDHSSLIFIIDENDNFIALLRPNEVSIDKINKYLKKLSKIFSKTFFLFSISLLFLISLSILLLFSSSLLTFIIESLNALGGFPRWAFS